MRLYELAQKLNVTSADLLRRASELELDVATAISSVDADAEAALRTGLMPPTIEEAAKRREAREAKAAALEALSRQAASADAPALEEARARAAAFLAAPKPALPDAPAEPGDIPAAPAPAAATPAPEEPAAAPAPEEPAVPRAAERAIGGIAPLPVRRATAPRPVLEFHRPPKIKPPLPPKKPAAPALHPADAEKAPTGPDKGGLQGAGGVPKETRRIRDADELRDRKLEKQKELRDRRKADRAAERAAAAAAAAGSKTIVMQGGTIVVKDLAERLGLRPNQLITELMKMGVLASINQSVDLETATKVATAHGFEIEHEKTKRNRGAAQPFVRDPAEDDDIPEDLPEQMVPRAPVVTFLGHVDHGKTSLMDYIRKAHVAQGEAGGITQAISAYTVDVQGREITFLDTPGHAAFSAMRARGANLTDIAVIIVAADDGIMPQTREAIQQARDAHVTIMVAINKCDLPSANPMKVMQQLQAENLTPEEWGGSTVVCQVSAVTGDGVGNLLDMILLQADVLELRANPNRRANGSVIEARMEPGSGPIVSVLVTGGTLKVGDVMLCGEHYGKIRALTESTGRRVRTAGPSRAVAVMGLSGVPEAGSEFRVMKNEKRARELADQYAQARKEELLGGATQARSVDDIFKQMNNAEKLVLNLVLRADVQGSVEAIVDSIGQIKSDKVSCNVIQSGTGAIAVNDIERADKGKALVIGFNVSPESGVNALARHDGVRVQTFRIIYELLDFVKQEMLALLPVEYKEVVRGHAFVKQVFDLGKEGVVAGSIVNDGFVTTEGRVRVTRRGKLLFTGPIATIRHFKETVKEVKQAQECGIMLDGFGDFEEGDVLECFAFEELPKTL